MKPTHDARHPDDHPEDHGEDHGDDHGAEPRHAHAVVIPPGAVEGTIVRGQEFLSVPGELLVDAALLEGDAMGARGIRRRLAPFARQEVSPGTVRFQVPFRREALTAFVTELRTLTDPPTLGVSPNHVFWPAFHRTYFPAFAPEAAPARFRGRPPLSAASGAVSIGVIDAGLADHPWLAGHAERIAGEPPETPGAPASAGGDPVLGSYAGHGTFVAGLVAQACPDAQIVHCRAVGPAGHLDDPAIANALWRLATEADCRVIVVPLGGFTLDNTAPLAISNVLDRIDAAGLDCVVVASAGNHASTRPVWPAATKRVLAVAAADDDLGSPATLYSGRGDWVDVYARGTGRVSTFYSGRFRLEHPDAPRGAQSFRGWATWTGTSFAAPHVAAVVANAVVNGTSARQTAAALASGDPKARQPGFGLFVA